MMEGEDANVFGRSFLLLHSRREVQCAYGTLVTTGVYYVDFGRFTVWWVRCSIPVTQNTERFDQENSHPR